MLVIVNKSVISNIQYIRGEKECVTMNIIYILRMA